MMTKDSSKQMIHRLDTYREKMYLSAQGKVTANTWAEPCFAFGVSATGLVFPACPLGAKLGS